MTTRTLRDHAADADADRFTGRDDALAVVRALFEPTSTRRVLYVHGPGGIGKSALLRAAGREAEALGITVDPHDARTLPTEFDLLVERVIGDARGPRCIVIDEADVLGAIMRPLRDALLDSLDGDTRLILAGRRELDPSWRDDGLAAIVHDLPLTPLDDAVAAELLEASGILDEARRDEIVEWAKGSPLALTVAASVPAGSPTALEAELESRLTGWLAGRSMLDVDPAVLEVAALVQSVDARLLAAALPGRPTREAMRALAALPVVQQLGAGLTLHPVLASAIRARLATTALGRRRGLVQRIAQHLARRARLGDIDALIELSLLVETEEYRKAFSSGASTQHYADALAVGEFGSFAREHGFADRAEWAEIEAWGEVAELDFVVRRRDGTPLLINRFARVSRLPALGRITGSLAQAAHAAGVDPERSFAGVCLFAEAPADELAEVARLASGAFMHRSGMPELSAILMHFAEPNRNPGLNSVLGFEIHPEGGVPVAVDDFRPLGVVGFVEAIVLQEQGGQAPASTAGELFADGDDPDRLARLRALVDRTFGSSADEQRLRRVIEVAHLGPRLREDQRLEALHVSRPTWYRLLREARERVLAAAEAELPA